MPSFIVGTSSEFLGRKPLPRAARYRPLVFVMGPSGVGKLAVARRLLGDEALYLSDREVLDAVTFNVREHGWDPVLLEHPAVILDGPAFLVRRPGFASRLRDLLVQRALAGRRTIVTEAKDGMPLTELLDVVSTDERATILLRFPVGRGRRRFAARVCDELGVDPRFARRLVSMEPWTYERVRQAILALRDDDDDTLL